MIPRLCGLAGLALVGMWLVAIATHLFVIGGSPLPAVVLLVQEHRAGADCWYGA